MRLINSYPITITVGKDKITFNSKEELLAYFSEVMDILDFEKTGLKVNHGRTN